MGVKLKGLISPSKIHLGDLSGRSIAFDGNNILYQFIAIIRGQSGEPLHDSSGHITSHLSGLLYRNSNLVEAGVKVVYVFDGKPPDFKRQEIERRRTVRREAEVQYRRAIEKGTVEEVKKYGQRAFTVTDTLVEESKTLLGLMGIPWIQAPSEGEAQSAYMATKGDVWASGSQDLDSLLFRAPRLVRNLSITGRRKLPGKNVYLRIDPEMIELRLVLDALQISYEQLIDIGILVGTDFNPDGVKGVGPKTAVSMIRKHGSIEKAVPFLKEAFFPYPVEEIKKVFLHPPVTDDYRISWRLPDEGGIVEFLCETHSFSRTRVQSAIDKLFLGVKKQEKASTLDQWFKPDG